jgi:hypothetical protein
MTFRKVAPMIASKKVSFLFQLPDVSGNDSSGVKLHLCLEPSFPGVAPHRTTKPSCGCSTTRTSGDDCWLNARFARSWLLLLPFLALDSFRPHLFPSLQQRRLQPHQRRLTSRSIVTRPPRLATSALDNSRALNYWKDMSRDRIFTRLAHLSFNLVPTEFLLAFV